MSRLGSDLTSSIASSQIKGEPWGVKALGCGVFHSAALTNFGHVYTWGGGSKGQLGLGKYEDKDPTHDHWTPQHVSIREQVICLAVGFEHTLAATVSGRLYAWGRGDEGQLGTGRIKDEFAPTLVVGFTSHMKVRMVAAGELHSAAIVDRGDGKAGQTQRVLYTWGSGESGKLGLGAETVAGQKQSPHLVKAAWNHDNQVGGLEPVLVCCGENHTGVIVSKTRKHTDSTPAGEVWMFGGGWYGRLGLNKTDNEYSPQEVDGIPPMVDLACGAFHTCAVSDGDEELWVWGRDKFVCEPNHLLRPKKFSHIEGVVKVVRVICGNHHTLVMTKTSAGDGHDLYVWGDNTASQLGLGENASDNVFIPVQIRGLPGHAKLVATAASHSMALLSNDELYAWGNQSGGRLGLELRQKNKFVRTPAKVNAGWASIETMCKLTQDRGRIEKDAGIDEIPFSAAEASSMGGGVEEQTTAHLARMLSCIKAGQKLESFATVQEVLRSELEDAKLHALTKKEDEVEVELRECLTTILLLPEKESYIKRLESCFVRSLGANLKFFRGVESPEKVAGNTDIQPKLRHYEELLWVLQQQPTYLATLSICLEGDRPSAERFYRLLAYLYGDFYNQRTNHLFVAVMKLMASKEVEAAKELDGVFTENNSRLLHCFTHFAYKSAMARHANRAHAAAGTGGSSPRPLQGNLTKIITDASGDKLIECPAVHHNGVEECLLSLPDLTSALLRSAMKVKDRIYLSRAEFDLAREGLVEDPASEAAEFVQSLDRFRDFLMHFRTIVLQFSLEPALRMIFSHVLEEVRGRQFAPVKVEGVTGEAAHCLPLLQLYVRGILIPIFERVASPGVSEKVLPKEVSAQANEDHWHNLLKVREFCEMMSKMDAVKIENKLLESVANNIRADMLKYLLAQADFYDNTKTAVLVDMFTSHFHREPQIVQMPTSSLMFLSNTLLHYMQRLRLKEDDPVEQLCAKIGRWDDEAVHQMEAGDDHLHNFTMNVRFLFQDRVFTICSQSLCPMPPRLCAKSEAADVVLYRYAEQTKHKAKHFDLMQILTEIDRLEPHIKTMAMLKEELENAIEACQSKQPRNYDMAKRLRHGTQVITSLQTMEANEANLFQFIATSVLERERHRKYLAEIHKGIALIKQAQIQHEEDLKRAESELQLALDASLTLRLPERFVAAAQNGAVPTRLEFSRMAASIEDIDEYGRKNQPTFAFTPTVTYSLEWLMKRKVVESREGIFKQLRYDKVQLVFSHLPDRTLEIACCIFHLKSKMELTRIFDALLRHGSPHGGFCGRTNQNVIAVISLSQQQLKDLKRAEASLKLPEGPDAFFTFNSENLVNLVSEMSVDRRNLWSRLLPW